MELNLKNPLIFLDIETTGINIASDRIIEITILKIFPNGKEETKTFRVNLQDNNIFTSEVYNLLPNDVIIVEPLKQKALSLSIPTISSIIGIISTTLFLITFLGKY